MKKEVCGNEDFSKSYLTDQTQSKVYPVERLGKRISCLMRRKQLFGLKCQALHQVQTLPIHHLNNAIAIYGGAWYHNGLMMHGSRYWETVQDLGIDGQTQMQSGKPARNHTEFQTEVKIDLSA